MSAWLTPESLAAAFLTLVVAILAFQQSARAVLLYALLGAVPLQLGAFSGRTISQGLLPAEAIATVLFVAWVFKRRARGGKAMPFVPPLILFFGLALVSLIAFVALPDYRVEGSVTLTVSIGQILLIVWPIGVYLAASEFLDETAQLEQIQRMVIVLALAQIAVPWVPTAWAPYTGWAWTFGIFAAPFALASMFDTRSVVAKVLYFTIALLPLIRGVGIGKAFLYGYVAAALGTIIWVRASKLVAIVGGLVAAVALSGLVVLGERFFTGPLDALLNKERQQYSYGGDSGRGALAMDALSIWQEAPVIGVGPANSYIYMLQRSPIGTPHNQYLNILVEFGILGLVGWLAFMFAAFRTGLHLYRTATVPAHRTYALGWLGMFAGLTVGGITGDFMIHSIRNGGLELFSGYYLQWIFLGGLATIHRLERHKLRKLHSEDTSRQPARRRLRSFMPRRPAAARIATS